MAAVVRISSSSRRLLMHRSISSLVIATSKGLKELSDTAKKFAKDFPDYAEALGQFADKVDENIKPLEVIKDKVKELDALSARGITFDVKTQVTVPKEDLQAIENAFKRMEDSATDSIRSLRTNVRLNSRLIKNTLGSDSLEAKEALSANFGAAISNLKNAMKAGTVSVRRAWPKSAASRARTWPCTASPARRRPITSAVPQEMSAASLAHRYKVALLAVGSVTVVERGQDEPVFGLAKERRSSTGRTSPGRLRAAKHLQFGLDGLFKNTRAMHSGVGSATANRYAEGGYVQERFPPEGPLPQHSPARCSRSDSMSLAPSATRRPTTVESVTLFDFGDSANDLRRVWATLFPLRAQFAELFGPAGFCRSLPRHSSSRTRGCNPITRTTSTSRF